jgi:hypothetical protein
MIYLKTKAALEKKNLDESKRIFPDLKLEVLLGTFRALGLLQLDETGKHHIDEIRLNQLSELSDYERQIYLASSMMVFYELGENIWQYFNKNRIVTVAKELHSFFQSLNANRMYPKTTLYKLFEIQEKKGLEYFLKNSLSKNKDRTELALKVLQTFSLIEKTENNFWKINSIDYVSAEKKLAEKLISMDSPNSFIVFPEITFSEAIELARFSSVLETGTTTRFALTKDSVVRAYRLGITSDKIIGALKNLSGRHVDQNIIWQLKDWEKRYSEVTLHTGVVLSLSKDRLYLANTEPLASMIAATLVPGIFLLNVDDEDDAAAVLQKACVDIIARNTIQNKSEKNMNGKTQSFFLNLDMNLKHSGLGFNDEKNNHQSNEKNIDEETSNEQKDRFRSILAKLKISKDQRDELSARIERRLILSDDQMNASSVKYEKLEARGLDYVGKYNISKQAISTGAILEVVWSDDEGVIQKIMGIPSSIEKINGEAVLVMHCKHGNNNQDNLIRIALGRISVLRRIKQSIFGE